MKNAFWLSFGNITGRLIRSIFILYAARALGVAGYGAFSYALSLAALFTTFSDIGVSPLLTRETVRAPERERLYIATTLGVKTALVGFSILLVIFGAPRVTKIPEAIPLLSLAAVLLAFDGFREFAFAISRAKERMEIEAGATIATNTAIALLGFMMLITQPKAKMLMIAYTAGSGIGLGFALFFLRKYLKNLWTSFDRKLVGQIVRNAWPFALTGILGSITINTDTVMLGWFGNASQVGFYAAAQRVVQLFYLFPIILVSTLFPTFARLAARDDKKARTTLEVALHLSLLFALPIVVGGIILSPAIIAFLFGISFLPAAPAFSLLLITLFFVFPNMLFLNALFAYNEQKSFVWLFVIGAFGNGILNAFLIPPFGITGAAAATITSQCLVTILTWRKIQTVQAFTTLPRLRNLLFATILMGSAAFALQSLGLHVLISIGISSLVYFGILFALKEPLLARIKQKNFT